MLSRLHKEESGQVVAWTVATMVIVFGFMAFAIDVGFFFHARRLAQNAADPAALAGASELPGCGDGLHDPLVTANDYAVKNFQVRTYSSGDTLGPMEERTYDVGGASFKTVYARVERQQNFLFARFVGVGLSRAVRAEAEAVCGPISEGGVCPFFIGAPSPDAPPQYDVNGKLISAYGLQVGKVYAMKVGAGGSTTGNFNILNLIDNSGGSAFRNFLASGCTDPDKAGQPVVVSECDTSPTPDCTVTTDPGAKSGPTIQALEGGANVTGLYQIERTDSQLFPNGHQDCNLKFNLDATGSFGTVIDSSGNPMSLAQVKATIDAKTDPAFMSPTQPPCGGIKPNGDIVPELLFPSVQGRFMQIVMTNGTLQGQSTPNVLGILRMYIVCWSNQLPNGSPTCAGNEPQGQVAIYGTFGDFLAPNLLTGGGLGNNSLAPKHVVLVK